MFRKSGNRFCDENMLQHIELARILTVRPIPVEREAR